MELQQLNNKYAFENSTKNYQKALRELSTFLNRPEWIDEEVEILTPEFNLPLQIDEKSAMFMPVTIVRLPYRKKKKD